jgi:hypothetical protein
MRALRSPYIALPLALILALFAGVIWYGLVRPVPEKSGGAIIINRTFQAAEKVERSASRTTRSLDRYPQELKYMLPDRYVLDIRLDNKNTIVRFWEPALPLQNVEIGQHVNVVYLERGIPFIWKKIFVKQVTPPKKGPVKE